MKANLLKISIASLCLPLLPSLALAAEKSVVEFNPQEAKSLEWQVVNDGVMGGLSKGKLDVSEDGILDFRGTVSLENNGGFSSIRTGDVKMDLSDAEGVVARVKGDGRTYQIRFGTDARFRGMEISFAAELPTEKNTWTEVKIPFENFVGSFRGMTLRTAEFEPSKISRVGLLLGDKKAGPFEVKVDWIRTYTASGSESSDLVATALADGRFGTLAKALTVAELVGPLQGEGPFTVFAPTDAAFAALPKGAVEKLLKPENRAKLQGILKYHVLSGATDLAGALAAGEAKSLLGEPVKIAFSKGLVRVNDAELIDADIQCSNGVIHVISSVILPPEPAKDIASVAKQAGKFKTLLAAVEAAGLSEALSGKGPLTVFAPTDEAFKKLPKGTVESLLKSENRDKLKAILALHVVSGQVSAGDALNARRAKALSGGALEFGVVDGLFQVNSATILKTDLECDNGVIHVIDSVLLPPADKKTKKETAMQPMERIEDAIHRGVPIFNDGDHAKCAAIYRECLMELQASGKMDAHVSKALRELVSRADKMKDDTHRAWILRSGLDHVYASYNRG